MFNWSNKFCDPLKKEKTRENFLILFNILIDFKLLPWICINMCHFMGQVVFEKKTIKGWIIEEKKERESKMLKQMLDYAFQVSSCTSLQPKTKLHVQRYRSFLTSTLLLVLHILMFCIFRPINFNFKLRVIIYIWRRKRHW